MIFMFIALFGIALVQTFIFLHQKKQLAFISKQRIMAYELQQKTEEEWLKAEQLSLAARDLYNEAAQSLLVLPRPSPRPSPLHLN